MTFKCTAPRMRVKRFVRFHLFVPRAVFLLSCLAARVHAQAGLPDNQLSTLSPIGVAPHGSTSGTNEQISLATGSLHVDFPILSLPQRGGWTLPLMYTYDSNISHPVQNLIASATVTNIDDKYGDPVDQRNYQEQYVNLRDVLEPNLPRLQASNEFMGFYPSNQVNAGFKQSDFIVHCITNFVFNDWTGASHSFGNILSCDNKTSGAVPTPISVTDTVDGSFYRLDTTSPSDIVVYAKNGVQYHFTGFKDPNANIPAGSYTQTSQVEDILDNRNVHMIDVNGNTINVTESQSNVDSSLIYTLVDTIGRTVTITKTGMSYLDSNGTFQQITISAPTAGPDLPSPLNYNNLGCYWNGQTEPYERTPTVSGPTPQSSASTTQVSITMPVSDFQGHARQYTLQLDAALHLVKVTYPSGGYTRYDFQDHNVTSWNGGVACSTTDFFQVAAKHVCRATSGVCGTEDTTTYTPSNIVYGVQNQNSPYNGTMTVKDALANAGAANGSIETHTFTTQGWQHTSALETDVTVANASGTLLRSTHTDYTSAIQFSELAFPQKVTVTFNASPNGVKQATNTRYGESLSLITFNNFPVSAYLDNPTEIDELDFAGKTLTTTTRSWRPSNSFSVPHVLDRLDTETLVDKVAGTSQQTMMGYDTLGNVSSKTVSGSNVVTNQITYGAYTNGYPASIKDGRGYTTTFGYMDKFVSGTCAPTTNSGAYVTSVTLPNNAKSTYAYNPCTGTLASSTDANGNTTSYTYDSLGRQTSAQMAEAFSTSTVFSDGAPNTVQVTTSAAPDPNVVATTTLDGLGRPTSSVTGGIEVDMTYDGDGRTSTVSNPSSGAGSDLTTSSYDALSRVTHVMHPDGSSANTTYFGEVSVVQDETGNTRVVTQNAQGLTASVCEIAGPMSGSTETPAACASVPGQSLAGYTTSYSYDGRGNLTNVAARTQTRGFSYDTFSRLLTAINPEIGTVCYGIVSSGTCGNGYDANGNLLAKTDANSRVTTYGYDVLNRLVTKHSVGATASAPGLASCYLFDTNGTASPANPVGRLTAEWTQTGSCPQNVTSSPSSGFLTSKIITNYDPMGRVLTEQTCTLNSCSSGHPQTYTYDFAGHLTGYGDGLGKNGFSQSYDGAGRLLGLTNSVSDPLHPPNLFNVTQYSPLGWTNATMGTGSAGAPSSNGLTLTQSFDNRQRVSTHAVTAGVQ